MKEKELFNIVDVICHSFRHLDPRLISHGERVAYILLKMLWENNRYSPSEKHNIFMLGLLHDIGAYKDDEIDSMLSFDTEDSMEHSVFGYLLFKNFSPLPEYADVILYHHHCSAQYYSVPISEHHRDIARVIYLADRIDIFCVQREEKDLKAFLQNYSDTAFSSDDIRWFWETEEKCHILEHIRSGEYHQELSQYTRENLTLTEAQMRDYLLMFIFSVDFRNEFTVLHTSYALQLSERIAKTLRLTSTSCKTIQLAAMLHNIGKISLSSQIQTIDDYDQYLQELYHQSTQEITREILTGAVDKQIIQIIEQSFQLLECWSRNQKPSFVPFPATEIVALSYLLSDSLTLDMNVPVHHTKLIAFLKEKYELCEMDNTILLAFEKHFDRIMQETKTACASLFDTYRKMKEEDRSLNMILLHYNNYNCKYN